MPASSARVVQISCCVYWSAATPNGVVLHFSAATVALQVREQMRERRVWQSREIVGAHHRSASRCRSWSYPEAENTLPARFGATSSGVINVYPCFGIEPCASRALHAVPERLGSIASRAQPCAHDGRDDFPD
jgi:hypothetical protein